MGLNIYTGLLERSIKRLPPSLAPDFAKQDPTYPFWLVNATGLLLTADDGGRQITRWGWSLCGENGGLRCAR
jgi:hypothetical protein